MLGSIRFVVCAVATLAWALGGAAISPQPASGTSADVCVRIDDGRLQYRALGASDHCHGHETPMFLVASAMGPFVADASAPPDLGPPSEPFIATFAGMPALVPGSGPLLVHTTLLVDADRAVFTLPPSAAVEGFVGGRGDPSNVSCAPTLDGQRIGEPTRLLPPGRTIEPPAAVVFDPVDRSFAFSPSGPPDLLWSRLDELHQVEAGHHQLAVACQGRLAFRFRGTVDLVILQRAPRH